MDLKHAVLLPVGHEGEFKLKKDRLVLKVPDGDKKARAYQVVAMQPTNSEGKVESSAYRPAEKPAESRPPMRDGSKVVGQSNGPPPR